MRTVLFLITLTLSASTLTAQNLYFPPAGSDDWVSVSPAELNWDTTQIPDLLQFLEDEETRAFIVLKDGKMVIEEYFFDFDEGDPWPWFSAGKSLAAFLTGIAVEEGALEPEDPVSMYLGEGWTAAPPEKEALIKVWNQLTMTCGLDESIFTCTEDSCLQYIADAGTRWAYHNGPYTLLHKVVEEATGVNWNAFTRMRVREKIGMNGAWIPTGDNNIFWSSPRSMARFGLLMLGDGAWNEDTLLYNRTYYQNMITPSQDLNPSYGFLWWLNGQESFIPPGIPMSFPGPLFPDAPDDLYLAAGALGQYCAVVPSQNLVVIRMGQQSDSNPVPIDLHNEMWVLLNRVIEGSSPIREVPNSELFKLYPNPVRNFIFLKTIKETPFRVHILDHNGKLVRMATNRKMIPVSDLPPGSYILRFYLEEKVATTRFIKN